MTSILITGGTGFIGYNLIKYLLSNTDYQIISLDKYRNHRITHSRVSYMAHDLRNPLDQTLINEMGDIEHIIHLAGATDAGESISNPSKYVLDNIIGTLNLLEYSRNNLIDLKKFIYFNTAEVYGPSSGTIFFEDQSYYAINPYAATKIGAQEMCLVYHRLYNIPVITTYTTNAFGPMQSDKKFIPLMIDRILSEQVVYVHADKSKRPIKRNYLHVDDVCGATLFLMKNGLPGAKYNITAKENIDNLKIVRIIASSLNKELKYELVFPRDSPLALPMLSGEKLRNLGWIPKKKFEESLREFVRWKVKK